MIPLFSHRLPRVDEITVDFTVLLFTVGVSLSAAGLSAVIPARHSLRGDLHATLGGSSGSTGGPRRARSMNALVMAEVGLSVVLLIGAGLFLRSLDRIFAIDFGFQPDRTLTFRLALPEDRDWAQAQAIHAGIIEQLGFAPDVESASISFLLPLSGRLTRLPLIADGWSPDEAPFEADLNIVTPEYFQTLGVDLLQGRGFQLDDTAASGAVAVISRAMAERLWPGQNPLGRRIQGMTPGIDGQSRTVVGVVQDVKHWELWEQPAPMVYLPYAQVNGIFTQNLLRILAFVSIRTYGDPETFAGVARETLRSLDPDQPVWELKSLERIVLDTLAAERLQGRLFQLLAGLALLLATIGLYGVMAYNVRQRTREMGIRMALGAERSDVVRSIAGRGLWPVAAGLGLGLAAAAVLSQWIELRLYEVDPLDLSTYVAVSLVLAGAALTACLIPALGATRINAAEALRRD